MQTDEPRGNERGLAVTGRKTSGLGAGRSVSDYTAAVFRSKGLALTAWGSQAPTSQKRNGRMGGSAKRRPFASPETG
jgi:hypothetical protein